MGVPEDIKNRLFKQMITNKGAQGTGLGVYISNTVIRAKFGGSMWMEDNPGEERFLAYQFRSSM